MIRRGLFLLMVGPWVLLSCLAQPAPPWKTFRPSDGAFQVALPASPKCSQGLTRTPLGQVTTSIYSCTDKRGTYTVISSEELPGAAIKFSSNQMLEEARQKLLTQAGAEEVSWNGQELSYRAAPNRQKKSPPFQGQARIFLAGNRLFVLDARGNPGQTTQADWAKAFFSSFSPLPEKN